MTKIGVFKGDNSFSEKLNSVMSVKGDHLSY